MRLARPWPDEEDIRKIGVRATQRIEAASLTEGEAWRVAVAEVQRQKPDGRLTFSWSTWPSVTAAYTAWIESRHVPPKPLVTLEDVIAESDPATRFDALAAVLAPIANLAYEPSSPEIRARLFKDGAANVKVIEQGLSRAVCFTRAGRVFIVFRGTRMILAEWALDFDVRLTGKPRRHSGFQKAWNRVEPQIRAWLDALPPELRCVILSGHSLGGAMAILAGLELDRSPVRIDAVVTFGSPRVGPDDFVNACRARALDSRTRRYTHETDLISRVPPPFRYRHSGQERFITASGAITNDPPGRLTVRAVTALENFLAPAAGALFPPAAYSSGLATLQRPATGSRSLEWLKRSFLMVPVFGVFRWVLLGAFLLAGLAGVATAGRDGAKHKMDRYCDRLRLAFPDLQLLR